MIRKWLGAALLALALIFAFGTACAEEARDITGECRFKSSATKFKYTQMTNGKFTNYWYTHEAKHNFLTFVAPSKSPIYSIYLCFKQIPDAYEVQVPRGSGWETVAVGDPFYAHAYFEIPGGAGSVRIYVPTETRQVLGFNQVYAFSEGEAPDWVQRWEPPLENADILFMSTHPDDELIFFGGAIPTAVDQGRKVAVSYLTYSNTTRRSELLNGLWALGVRNYPYIGDFTDSYGKNAEAQYKALGGEKKVHGWAAGVIRQAKPRVIVCQDLEGEYGHPMHKVMADTVTTVFSQTADPAQYPESAEQYGVWQADKLYVHLWKENSSRFDWETPLASFDGKTGIELADTAYRTLHVSQKASGMSVDDEGVKYDNHLFGLYASTVGPDVKGGDFFEHLEGEAEPAASPEPVETPEPEKTRPESGEAQPESGEVPTESAESPAPAADPTSQGSVTEEKEEKWVETDPELAAILPELNAKGFLDEGEFIWSSDEKGLYVYVGTGWRIVIRRGYEVPDKKHPFYYFEANIWCDVENGVLPVTVFADPEHPRTTHKFVRNIAEENRAVFATSTDYYTYRIKQTYPTGIEVRNGVIFYDEPRKNPPTMPNYETLAFFADGRIESHPSTEMSAKDYLNAGAANVFCFGPCLIRDGQFTEYLKTAHTSYNPRYAFGMVEPGHYVALLCEGRVKRSKGVQMTHLAQMMMDRGCTVAVNLDGGQSAVFAFMGRQLNEVVSTDPKGRAQAEVLAFGFSDQVGEYNIGP